MTRHRLDATVGIQSIPLKSNWTPYVSIVNSRNSRRHDSMRAILRVQIASCDRGVHVHPPPLRSVARQDGLSESVRNGNALFTAGVARTPEEHLHPEQMLAFDVVFFGSQLFKHGSKPRGIGVIKNTGVSTNAVIQRGSASLERTELPEKQRPFGRSRERRC